MKDEYTDWIGEHEEELIKEFILKKGLEKDLHDFLWTEYISWRSSADDYIYEMGRDYEIG